MPAFSSSPGTIVMQSVGQANSQRPQATQRVLPVVELHQHRHAAEGVGVVDALFGVLDHEGHRLAAQVAAEVAEEVGRRSAQARDDHGNVQALEEGELLRALDLHHPGRHGAGI